MAYFESSRSYFPPATSLAFDSHAELLWSGSLSGHVQSYFTGREYNLARYTSYRAHVPGPTREISIDEKGILSVGGSLKLANRRGVALWNVHDSGNITSAAFSNAGSSEVLAGGMHPLGGPPPDLILVNVGTGTVLRRTPSSGQVSFVRRSHLVCCGQANGQIVLRDPRTLRAEQTVNAHASGLSGLEADGNFLYSFGYTVRHGVPVVDPLVKVFDTRNLRPMPPVSFPSLPAFVRPHPRSSSLLVVASAQGQGVITDLLNPSNVQFFAVETDSYLTSMAMAPTGEGMAFTDADNLLHMWTSSADPTQEPSFCRFAQALDVPEPPEPPKIVNWTEETPLSMIGMPFYDHPLFSSVPWKYHSSPYSPLGQPPQRIDPALLASMKTVDFVGYALNPKTSKRNQAVLRGSAGHHAKRKMDVPLFRSEKERERAQRHRQRRRSDMHMEGAPDEEEQAQASMPKYYRKVEIKYSKFGVEDFDFEFYNKTAYSGLETHILNSYTNALLQILRFIRPIRKLAEGHIWTNCPREFCFLCEAGFLFKMMRDANGVNCQASNFSRAFTSSQQAAALGLMDFDDSSSQTAYSALIQTANRFLLETMTTESDVHGMRRTVAIQPRGALQSSLPILSQLIGLHTQTINICSACGHQAQRESIANVLDLVYPRKALSNEIPPPADFPSILQASISRENLTKATCPNCRQFVGARVKRRLVDGSLPAVLAINAAVHTSEQMEHWLDSSTKGPGGRLLQPYIALDATGRVLKAFDPSSTPRDEGMVVYELSSMVVQIQAEDDPAHLVSLVKVAAAEGADAGWHLFNDFLVRPVSEEEALSFPGTWKIPAILYYQRSDCDTIVDFSALEVPPDDSILVKDVSISKLRRQDLIRHRNLTRESLPRKGTFVSIDAEFVSLQQEEVEYHSDGMKKIIRPTRMTLARVSVLRGEGTETGIPFIDDHILVNEPIVDYLTEFSGIMPGDLDSNKSVHTLVPAKVAYKKLRLLVDKGCVFIGHGLNKDFRIINIFVPPSQILDTVNIYHLPHRHRKISLRFLSWVVLDQDIQSSGTHDSIEDARTALQLYEKHSQLEAEGKWENVLEDIYVQGGKLGWKVPGSDKAPPSPAMDHSQQLPHREPIAAALPAAMDRLSVQGK